MTSGDRIEVMAGDRLEMPSATLICARFERPRRVCSDTCWNGGVHGAAEAVANHQMQPGAVGSTQELDGYCRRLLNGHQLPAGTILQLTSACLMDGGLAQEDGGGFAVTAVVTAGVNHNAVCAGDPAAYEEIADGEYRPFECGTINSMIFVDADVPFDGLLHGLTVVAECKTDELMRRAVRSHYSAAGATGTGTDTTTVVCNPFAAQKRTTTSTHSRLGMAIARATRRALTQALAAEGKWVTSGGSGA